MSEFEEVELERRRRDFDRPRSDGVWKWLVGLLLGALLGVLTGQYTPNRNIATVDQIKDTNVKIDTLTTEVSGLKDEVADLRGQLRAQKLLSNP